MNAVRLMTLLLLTVVCASTLCAADAPQMDDKAMMEAMAKIAAPGENHKRLEIFVGNWDTKITMWMAPGAPPVTSTGTSTNAMVMGGRYLEQRYAGSFMGQPFHGLGYTGYDNVTKAWWGSWMDDMSTGLMVSHGRMEGENVWSFEAKMADPMTGAMTDMIEKLTVRDKDHHTMEMWMPGPDGKLFLSMQIDYARSK